MIEFSNGKLVINTAAVASLEISLKKTGISSTTVSANVLLTGADILYPSAQQYNGIKKEVIWLAGQQGEKTVSIPLEGTANPEEYVLATIDDCLGDTIGKINRAYILLSKNPSPNSVDKFLPTAQGNYINVIAPSTDGFTSKYVKESDLEIAPFTPNTPTTAGSSGSVPAPPLGNDPLVLTNKGWSPSPQVITAPVGDADLTVANTEFVDRGLDALEDKLSVPFTPNTPSLPGVPGLVPAAPAGTDPQVLTNDGWSSTPRVITAPIGDKDLTVANTEFVDRGLQLLDEKVSAPFVPSTATTPGKSGAVPEPPISTDPLVLTNDGWSSSPRVITAPIGDDDLTVANTEFVDRGLQALEEKVSVPFVPSTPNNAGMPGVVPGPPMSADPLVLTNDGWSSTPEVLTAPTGDADLTVANTEFVANGLAALDDKFTNLTNPFTSNTPTSPGTAGVVPGPPASVDPLVLTNEGWSSSPRVITPPVGDNDQSVANTEFVNRGLTALNNAIRADFPVTPVFTPNTSSTAGTQGSVPGPQASSEPLILTSTGWSADPQVRTADLGDNDRSLANTSFVQQIAASIRAAYDAALNGVNSTIQSIQAAIQSLQSAVQGNQNSIQSLQAAIQSMQGTIQSLQSTQVSRGSMVLWMGKDIPSGYIAGPKYITREEYPELYVALGPRSGDGPIFFPRTVYSENTVSTPKIEVIMKT